MKITASDINSALEALDQKRKTWKKEHPDEKEEVCPECNNSGLIRRYFDEFGKERFGEDTRKPGSYEYLFPCKCVKNEESQLRRNNKKFAAVPQLYRNARFENFEIKIYRELESITLASNALRDSKMFVEKFEQFETKGMGLYIYSTCRGSGKTRLASTITNELTERDIRVRFESANNILTEIQKSWNSQDMTEATILNRFMEPKVLVIDDFGARSGRDWIDEKYLMIIDSRYQKNKITIFTSNFEIEKLPFNDMRIIDRLSDIERFHVIRMPNESLRRVARVIKSGERSPFYKIAEG